MRITSRIASGGTGSIYKAVDPATEHRVAVKILETRSSEDDEAYRCFRTEVLSLARITHPHAVRLYDWGRTDDGHWYIVTELLEGRSLDAILRDGPISVERCLTIVDDVAAVLEEAHRLGIVHRDIKPANIFLQEVGSEAFVRVLDFGIARLVAQPAATDRPSGTPTYMSPEQIHGVNVDGRTDIYALGIVAYECLAGQPPFSDPTPTTVMARQLTELPPPLSLAGNLAHIPNGFVELIAQMLEKERERRPASAAELRRQLAEFRSLYDAPSTSSLSGLPANSERNLLPAPELPRSSPRDAGISMVDFRPNRSAWLGLLALLSLLLLLVAVVGPERSVDSEPQPTVAAVADLSGVPGQIPLPPEPPPPPEPTVTSIAVPDSQALELSVPRQRNKAIARPAVRALRVCYELFDGAELTGARLFIDGRRVRTRARNRCFRVRSTYGRHTFTLVGDRGVRIELKRKVTSQTDGVFFLVE